MAESDLNLKRRGWLTAYAPLFVWIGVIFFLSSSNGSMTETSRFIRPILEFLFPAASEQTLLNYHFYIRKLAHFTEYAVLGCIAVRAFLHWSSPSRTKFAFAISLLLVALVAIADEFNQSFNSLRTSSASDVLLDCLGGVSAIVFYIAIRAYFAKRAKSSLPSSL